MGRYEGTLPQVLMHGGPGFGVDQDKDQGLASRFSQLHHSLHY